MTSTRVVIFAGFAFLVLGSNVGAGGSTAVYKSGDFLRASINNEKDAQSLYQGLDLKVIPGRSGQTKVYRTMGSEAEITCTESSIPGAAIRYTCTISILVAKAHPTTIITENDQLELNFSNLNDAKALFEALSGMQTNDARSGQTRMFQTIDRKVTVYCNHDTTPVGLPFGCTIRLELE